MSSKRNPASDRARPLIERLARRSPFRTLLRVPLFYKILVGNAAIVLLGSVAAALLVVRLLGGAELVTALQAIAMGALLSLILGIGLNALMTVLALAPLDGVKETARRVEAGERQCRAPDSPLADRDLQRLVQVFNRMLESLEAAREREQRLALQVLEAEEKDRQGISRELYDDVAQRLAALLLSLQAGTGDSRASDRLARARGEVVEILEGIRRLARELRPPELDELGLLPALRALARTVGEREGLDIRVDAAAPGVHLDSEAALVLYRIVQEALTNAAKHSRADNVTLTFGVEPGSVVTTVSDDGCGFDPAELRSRAHPGLGLLAMHERASYAGGDVTVDSGPDRGTRVRVVLPCHEPESAPSTSGALAL